MDNMESGNCKSLKTTPKKKVRKARRRRCALSISAFSNYIRNRARRMKHAKQKKRKSKKASKSTQTVGALVALWGQKLLAGLRYMVPTGPVLHCNWADLFMGRHVESLVYFLVVLILVLLNLSALMAIYEKVKPFFKY